MRRPFEDVLLFVIAASTTSSGDSSKWLPNAFAPMALTVSFAPRRMARNAFMRASPPGNHVW